MTLSILLALAGCDPGASTPEIDDGIILLDQRRQLIRLSVDLRGRHPTEQELVIAETQLGAYEGYADLWLDDPAFLERIREIYNLRLLTRTGNTYFDLDQLGVSRVDEGDVGDIIGEEPLRLLTHIVANDRSFREMVTADYTVANPMLAHMWDIEYPEGKTGWQPSVYRDGRPHAGVLSMTTTWQRYPSMGGNANRHRANAISKMFLCDDYLSRPIVLDRLAVEQLTLDPEDAISRENCQSCHVTLDPLAANLFGFFVYDADGNIEETVYRPELESAWVDYANRPPGFYGTPTKGLQDMGRQLSEDPRFADCAVQTVFEGLTQREIGDQDWDEIAHHRKVFVDSDLNIKQLVHSIVLSREYRASAIKDPDAEDRIPTIKTASPGQLAGIIDGITGYRWAFDGRDGMTTQDLGLPVLAGGVDGQFVTVPNRTPTLGSMFVQERLAQSAAYNVAAHDLDPARKGPAILLRHVTVEDNPTNNPDAFRAQIRALYLDATGVPLPADAPEPDQLTEIWKQMYSVDASATQAWAGVLSAVLRDPAVLFY